MNIIGGCVCGAFRYSLTSEPDDLGDCHCIDCRKSSGAPYVTWGTVPRDSFKVTRGAVRKIAHADRVRGFAQCCGTHVLFENPAEAATVDVAIATLDDPSPFPPAKAIWIEDRLPWVVLDPTLPSHWKSSRDDLRPS